MNALKIFALSFKNNIFSFILVILEISALLIAENYMICTLNEREMLNAAYYPVLTENSAFVYDMGGMYYDGTFRESRQNLLAKIPQNYKIYDTLIYSEDEISVISVSDEIYANFKLPLSYGSYGDVSGGAVAAADTKKGEHKIDFGGGSVLSLNVCGLLTKTTYLPEMTSFKSSEMTISDFYVNSINDKNIILTSRSAIKGFEDKFSCTAGFIIEFPENAAENLLELSKSKAITVNASEIITNSNSALSEDRASFLPLVMSIGIVVVIGITCISVITFKENERRNAVLWICGYSRAGIIGVHTVGTALMTAISVIISLAAYGLMKISGNEMVVGINLTFENFIVTVITCILLSAISSVVPVLKCRNISPAEYIRRAI